jgi:hypothetical protein
MVAVLVVPAEYAAKRAYPAIERDCGGWIRYSWSAFPGFLPIKPLRPVLLVKLVMAVPLLHVSMLVRMLAGATRAKYSEMQQCC